MRPARRPFHRRPRLLRGLVAAFAGAAIMAAATAPSAQAGDPGDHSRFLDALKMVTANVDDGNTPGSPHGMDQIPGAVGRTEVDGVQWAGTADNPATQSPRQADAKFRAASNTKMFTSAVVMKLVAANRLKLTDDVFGLLGPILKNNPSQGCNPLRFRCFDDPKNGGLPITVLNLLNMSSGIKDYMGDYLFDAKVVATFPNTVTTPRELVASMAVNGPQFDPGKGFEYSNTNYAILGMIVEKVTGMAWEDAVKQMVVDPLGLTDTTVPKADDTVLPQPHDPHWTNFTKARVGNLWIGKPAADQNISYAYGTGAVVSTTGDLIKFLKALLQGRLVPEPQLTTMLTTLNMNTVGTAAPALPPGVTCNTGFAYPECFPNPKIFNVTSDANAPTNWYADEPWKQQTLRYGLGIVERKLTCADGHVETLYGHNGGIPGSFTYTYSNRAGTHLASWNLNGDWVQWELFTEYGTLAAEFC
ncbi:serine hydrolase domain-containing protein [Yinghuangia seranimata]|uniref:serine hydrolase domain-containing protein n=1 Tax=Yinghuangia seranimata TaxID=408067 RepID=UPI00248B69A4|nr:serine hydrolase domain-containing protein [Yinghuangia seranimata]MDI2131588.1 serine hydrolase domain-containing protein [Yinghuangia seranimata]